MSGRTSVDEGLGRVIEEETRSYRARTEASRRHYETLAQFLPGGNSRTQLHFAPYPLVLQSGSGARVVDVDGNEYLDLLGNYGVLIFGHIPDFVVEAVRHQSSVGTVLGAPTQLEYEVASRLQAMMPSLERLRFTNSGTEATMHAIRAARAFTGRDLVAKFEGGFHGTHDWADVSVRSGGPHFGPVRRPVPVAGSRGIPEAILREVLVLPFNDLDASCRLLTEHAADVAVVCVEPFLNSGGSIPAEPGFVEGITQAASEIGALVLFDEVFSFRIHPGGMQEKLGVRPDLTALGKGIAGGLPFGAFGGREDVMGVFDPSHGAPDVFHAGTFNANSLSLAAAVALLDQLTPESFTRANSVGERLRELVAGELRAAGVSSTVSGVGPVSSVHFGIEEVRNVRDTWKRDPTALYCFFLGLLNRGVYMAPRGFFCVSMALEDDDVTDNGRPVGEGAELLAGER